MSVALLENFEFSIPIGSEYKKIYRRPVGLMAPMSDDPVSVWMGLKVKSVK